MHHQAVDKTGPVVVANQMTHVVLAKETATTTGTVTVETAYLSRVSVETATVETSHLMHPPGQIAADLGLIQTLNRLQCQRRSALLNIG